jgi:hypothetical protein
VRSAGKQGLLALCGFLTDTDDSIGKEIDMQTKARGELTVKRRYQRIFRSRIARLILKGSIPRKLLSSVSVVTVLAGVVTVRTRDDAVPLAVGRETITGASIGVPQTYPGQVALHARGDTWYNTWGSQTYKGDIFATSDDSTGFGGKCNSNIVVNELGGATPGALSLAYENCMTSFGTKATNGDYGDGRSWKTDGIISVNGTLYLFVARQQNGSGGWPNGFQPASNASIIDSTDGGRTWSNGFGVHDAANGAAPQLVNGPDGTRTIQATFPGSSFATPQFINYGQDDDPASTADGGNQYVYAISNDGYAYDGSSMILGRVLRSKIGKLAGADWQFYTGQPNGDGKNPADWSGNVGDARPILTATHQLSESSVQYIPRLKQYVMTDSYYPFVQSWGYSSKGGGASQTTWLFYEAPHPWGPWTKFFSAPTTECYFACTPGTAEQLGLYDPALVSKFIGMDGLSGVIFTSGDFSAHNQSRPNDQRLYMLHALPITFDTGDETIVDDAAALPAGSTDWQVQYDANGYFDNTMHGSDVPGDSASYTFTGTSISWVGSENSDQGIADVSIDGGTPQPVDTYNPMQLTEQVLFTESGLVYGQHTITIQVTAGKNASSSGTYQDIDAFIVGD